MRNKILSLLVLLLTAASGAWANDVTTVFELNGSEATTGTLTLGTNSVEATTVNIHTNTDNVAGIKFTSNYSLADGKYFTIAPATGSFKAGDKLTIAVCFNNADDTKTAKAVIYAADGETLLYTTDQGINGRTMNDNPKVEEYVLTQDAEKLYFGRNGNTATFVTMLKVVRPAGDAPAAGPEITYNDAKTEASFDMPADDATVSYELVRDMSVQMNVKVGEEGEDGFRIRIKKNEQQQFEPAEMQFDAMLALFTVNDEIEEKTLTFYGQTVDCKLSIFAVDDQDQPTGDAIAFTALTPGRYVAIATAAEGSAYDGTTAPSNIFELYQGYEVTVPAGEYATFYKNENLYVEDENAKLYTISSVTDTEAVLSEAIDVAPALTPLLVFNSSDEAKTILLIPTEEEADNVEAYEGFKGTLEAKEMSGSNEETDFYVCNGKNFVWVKGAGTIGANKCWLEVSKNAAARKLNIVIGEATGVNAVESGKWNVESLYDLNGRKLQGKPTKKGVYILNGRKVVVK